MLSKLLKNKVVGYTFSRYAIYALQFVNTFMLAKLLSPFDFGIWSFTQLIIMYFAHIDFGIPSSFNALVSIHKQSTKFVTFNFNAALTLTALVCGLVIVFFASSQLMGFSIGTKYKFDTYLIYVVIIIVLSYFNRVFMNLYRVYNRLKEITFFQAVVPIAMLGAYILFKEDLIYYLLMGMIFANVAALLLFLYNSPLSVKFNFSKKLLTQIQKSGLYFFIYNASFYFILLTTRSIIGYFYSVEEFGLFNFAFSLANIIELTLSAFVFLIFPKMINRLANSDDETAINSINFMQSNYTVLVSLMSYFAIALFPIFIVFFPAYQNSVIAFYLILLTKLIYTNCFGAPVLLMARKKERKIAGIAFFALIINVLAALSIVYFCNVSYQFAILGTGITYTIYVLIINRMSFKELNSYNGFFALLCYTLPLKQSGPLLAAFSFALFEVPTVFYALLPISFIVLNLSAIMELKKGVVRVMGNPEVVDI
ncbi:MAG: oligosaccharide flippase family protein [Crocinitomicaceae bacterium]|nr:oligosaccharide flippase family protein [Crocinitomicaceae bacterium]